MAQCGTELSGADTCCSACGCPVEVAEANPAVMAESTIQQVEVASVKVSTNTKKVATISIAGIALCVLLLFVFKYVGDVKSKKEFISSYNAYIDNLKKVQTFTLSGGADAEST